MVNNYTRVLVRNNLILIFIVCIFSQTAYAAFTVDDHSVITNIQRGTTEFTITFTETPDFVTTDVYGRKANSIQFYIYGDSAQRYPSSYASIIRGGEIDTYNQIIPVRDPSTRSLPDCQASTQNPSGDWGCVSLELSYILSGQTLSFSADTSDLTQFTNPDGSISYDILLTEFGDTSDSYVGLSSVVPVPAAVWMFGAGVGILFGFRRRGQVSCQ